MAEPQKWRAILLSCLGCLAASFLYSFNVIRADTPRLPARTVQAPFRTGEPPLADAPGPNLPPQPLFRGQAPPLGPEMGPLGPGPVDPPAPVVAIRVRVPATASAGQELEYRICVENLSQAAAHHVIVRNPLPANARFVRANPEPSSKDPELIWELGTLQGCACREIVLVLAAAGVGDVKNCARVQFEHGQCVTTRIARPALSLRKNGPTQAFVNETLRFQLIVTNTGATELTGVTLTDTLPPELEYAGGQKQLTWDLGTLAPG